MSYTIFVTGGSGFIGSRFIHFAKEAGHTIKVLTRSEKSAERVRALGAEPVMGDLHQPGPWQEVVASAQVVLHLAQPETYGEKVTAERAERFRVQRLKMDANLLDCLKKDVVHRIIYVGGTSYYGHQGEQVVDEDAAPNPKGWGPYIAPAIEALQGYLKQGLPIIEAFPAWVYGLASWYAEYNLEPLAAGKAVVGLRGPTPTISVVHVDDVARALLHLIDHGEVGKRYFITDDRPVPSSVLAEMTAKSMDVPLRMRRFPRFLTQLVMGPIVTESLTTEVRLSNERLKQTGFTFHYPTVDQGIPHTVKHWQEKKKPSGKS